MIKTLSQKIASYLAENGGEKEKRQIYAYGVECFLNEFISDLLLLIIGLLTHRLPELIIWCAAFIPIRIHLGGYHAPTHFRCIAAGTVLGACSLLINPLWARVYPYIPPLMLLLVLLLAFRKAPILHKNHPASEKRKKSARIRALILIAAEGGLAMLLMPFIPSFAAPVFTGIFTAAGMAAAELIRRIFLSKNSL